MPKLLKIGIVGCGAIGTSLAKAVTAKFADRAVLSMLFDTDAKKIARLAQLLNIKTINASNLEELIKKVDLVVECACASSSYEIARKALYAKKDIMIMSSGGIVEKYKELLLLAQKNNANLYIPSGAICGLDGLKAASENGLKKVVLVTRKPPSGFRGVEYVAKKNIDLGRIKEDTVLFEGSADLAIANFPANINVAATLSILGLGAKNTIVKIIASPNITRNIHEIEIYSDAGTMFTRTENTIHPDNPKTSFLAVLSAIAMLQQVLGSGKIGT